MANIKVISNAPASSARPVQAPTAPATEQKGLVVGPELPARVPQSTIVSLGGSRPLESDTYDFSSRKASGRVSSFLNTSYEVDSQRLSGEERVIFDAKDTVLTQVNSRITNLLELLRQ